MKKTIRIFRTLSLIVLIAAFSTNKYIIGWFFFTFELHETYFDVVSKEKKDCSKEGYFRKKKPTCFFFIEERGKPFCLKCKMPLAVMKKENLRRPYEVHYLQLKNLDGELKKMKIEELKKDLHAQQSVMTSFCSSYEDVLTVG